MPLALQVQIHQIRNEDDQAVKLIQAFVNRPNLGPQALGTLAGLAEKMKQISLAEKLYRQQESLAGTLRNKLALATFLGRHDHVNEGLSICEPLWKTVPEVELLTVTSINILFGSDDNAHTSEPAQIERVAGWIELALEQAKKQRRPTRLLLLGLGNVREQQGKYVEAKNWYQLATNKMIGTESRITILPGWQRSKIRSSKRPLITPTARSLSNRISLTFLTPGV